jgi:hypothetical protein
MNGRSDPVKREDGKLKIRMRLLAERIHLLLVIWLVQMRLRIYRSSLTAKQKVTLKALLWDCREYLILLNIYPHLMKK